MQLETIEQIINGMQVFMPSGLTAFLSMDENGNIIVEYRDELDSLSDTYSQDEFGNIIKDGIEIFEEPSQMVLKSFKRPLSVGDKVYYHHSSNHFSKEPLIVEAVRNNDYYSVSYKGEVLGVMHRDELFTEDEVRDYQMNPVNENKISTMNRLEKLAKCAKNVEDRQKATSLLDSIGMGVDVKDEVKKFFKKIDKEMKKDESISEMSDDSLLEYNYNKSDFKNTNDFEDVERKIRNDLEAESNDEYKNRIRHDLHVIYKWDDEFHKNLRNTNESMNEISDELANKVNQKRKDDVNQAKQDRSKAVKDLMQGGDVKDVADADDNLRDKIKKLDKNVQLNDRRNMKENKAMGELGKLAEELNSVLNEISDDLVASSTAGRKQNHQNAEDKEESRFQNFVAKRKKAKETKFLDPNTSEEEFDQAQADKKTARTEWEDSEKEVADTEKKLRRNIDLSTKRIFRQASKNEEFVDEMSMLTDINDLDFPQALQDTVETTEEGEVLTLGNAVEEIKDEIEELKDEIKDELTDIKDQVEAELSAEDLADVEEIEFIEEPTEAEIDADVVEEVEEEAADEEFEEEKEDEAEEAEEKEEEPIEEGFKKFIKKGCLEDLQKTKQEIDNMNRQGKEASEIKDTITMMSDDNKEKEQAQEYAISKLKESLMNTKYTSKLKNI